MIRIKKVIAILFPVAVILFFSQSLFSQSINKPYYQLKTITTDDGLCSNAMHCIYKDSRGFIWVGTENGAQRFNGSSFLTFRHINADSSSIASENISSIAEDKEHNVWITTTAGITKFSYSNGKLTNYQYGYKEGHPIKLELVFCFFEDREGRKWIGTVSAGLFLFDKIRQQFINIPLATYPGMRPDWFQYIGKIQETEKKEIVFSVDEGFVIIDSAGRQQYVTVPVPTDKKIIYRPCVLMPLLKEHPDEIWISSMFNGIFKFTRSIKKWEHYFSNDLQHSAEVRRPIDWSDHEWLVSFNSGIYIFNHRTGAFTKDFDDDRITNIQDVYMDRGNNLWIASGGNGLQLLNISSQLFSSAQNIEGWKQDGLMYYDSIRQTLYSINPYNVGGIMSLNAATNTIRRDSIPGAIKFSHVINNFIADDSLLYLARWGGMCRYNLFTRKLDSIVYKNNFFNSQQGDFFDVCKSGSKVYFAGRFGSGGPYMFDKLTHNVTDLALLPENLAAKKYHSLSLAFSDHVLYAGMNLGDSIYCYNEYSGEKKSIAFPAAYNRDSTTSITGLCIDKKQDLWCGTNKNGICVFNIPSQKWIRHIGQQDGYFAGTTSQLVCDMDGNIWCNTSEGLYVFNINNFLFKHYTHSSGLATENASGFLCLLSNHQLVYNNITGNNISFGIINTKSVDTTIQAIPISISDLKVSGSFFLADTLLDNVQQVIFPPNQNAFSLSYAGISIAEEKNLLYTYLLEGAEKKWHDAGNEHSLSYLNLTPGKYTLHIKCKSRDEKIVGEERLLYITMLPAWYQTWLFKLLSILIISFLLFFALKYYFQQKIKKQQTIIEKEKALNEERNRIAADIHDDVGAGLSRIRYITASMKNKQQVNEHDINKIVSLSDESVEKMNEIIWALNQGSQQLDELIYYTRSNCSEMVNNAGLVIDFQIPQIIPVKIIAWKDCRNIYLLVKEAVNNAIKHASAKKISIRFEMNGHLLIQVKDDGIGFNADELQKQGNGLLNYKKRVASLNGNYSLLSSAGNGTALHFDIPLVK